MALADGRGDAFLHMSVLKAAGYIWVPWGTTMQVRVEVERGTSQVTEVLSVDTSTAWPGESEPILRKTKAPQNPLAQAT